MSVSLLISLICTGYISKLKYSQLSTTFVGEMIEVPLFDLKCVLQLSPHTLTHTHSHAHNVAHRYSYVKAHFPHLHFLEWGGRRGWRGLGEAICGCSRTFLMFDWTLLLFLTAVNGSASVCVCVCMSRVGGTGANRPLCLSWNSSRSSLPLPTPTLSLSLYMSPQPGYL